MHLFGLSSSLLWWFLLPSSPLHFHPPRHGHRILSPTVYFCQLLRPGAEYRQSLIHAEPYQTSDGSVLKGSECQRWTAGWGFRRTGFRFRRAGKGCQHLVSMTEDGESGRFTPRGRAQWETQKEGNLPACTRGRRRSHWSSQIWASHTTTEQRQLWHCTCCPPLFGHSPPFPGRSKGLLRARLGSPIASHPQPQPSSGKGLSDEGSPAGLEPRFSARAAVPRAQLPPGGCLEGGI